jgi:hypothetical protein
MSIKDTDANYVELLPYRESLEHIVTLTPSQLDYKLWLEIPNNIAKDLTLTEVKYLGLTPTTVDIETNITRDSVRPWLVFNQTAINKTPGFHMLEFIFRNNTINTYQSLYFCYMSQVDNPEKPYIYMERKDTV